MSERKKVTAAVIFKNGKVLVAQRSPESSLPNKWEFPGGKMEENETPEDCLNREIREELNIDIKVKEYLCSSFFDYNHISIELMAYTCEWQSGKLKNNEHQALSWLNPEELRGLDMAPADWPIVEFILKS